MTTLEMPALAAGVTFAELGLPARYVSTLAESGITEPFPIQAATIPDLVAGLDVCGRAPTGSGKTLAFGLPMLARIGKARPCQPTALILAPTRELAAQIQADLTPVAKVAGRFMLAVYGGVGYEPQKRALRKGVDILVACPGRLKDLIQQRAVSLQAVEVVVIDEADRMCDMGFLPEVKRLLDMTPSNRQTVLFSATLDGSVADIIKAYQHNPTRHDVAGADIDINDMEHRFIKSESSARLPLAADLIRQYGSTIMFCRTRHGSDRVVEQFARIGIEANAIHGGLSQKQRDRSLAEFKRGAVQVMVATDVAARGIHVSGVECVIHFDPPEDASTYVHRSGRTARAGATGVVVSLVDPSGLRASRKMMQELKLSLPIEGAKSGDELVGQVDGKAARRGGGGGGGRSQKAPQQRPNQTPSQRRGEREHGWAAAGDRPEGGRPAGSRPAGGPSSGRGARDARPAGGRPAGGRGDSRPATSRNSEGGPARRGGGERTGQPARRPRD